MQRRKFCTQATYETCNPQTHVIHVITQPRSLANSKFTSLQKVNFRRIYGDYLRNFVWTALFKAITDNRNSGGLFICGRSDYDRKYEVWHKLEQ